MVSLLETWHKLVSASKSDFISTTDILLLSSSISANVGLYGTESSENVFVRDFKSNAHGL